MIATDSGTSSAADIGTGIETGNVTGIDTGVVTTAQVGLNCQHSPFGLRTPVGEHGPGLRLRCAAQRSEGWNQANEKQEDFG